MSKRRVFTPCAAALVLALGLLVSLGEARVTRIETTSPGAIAEGMPSSSGGASGKLLPLALDPADSRNAVRRSLDEVPTNAAGNVEFSRDLSIPKPVDTGQGDGKVFGKDAAPLLSQADPADVPQKKGEPEATEKEEPGREEENEEEEEEDEPEEDKENES